MTRVNPRLLSPAARAQIEAGGSTAKGPRTPTPTLRDQPLRGESRRLPRPRPPRYRCGSCPAVVEDFAPAERHANEAHHGARLELLP